MGLYNGGNENETFGLFIGYLGVTVLPRVRSPEWPLVIAWSR